MGVGRRRIALLVVLAVAGATAAGSDAKTQPAIGWSGSTLRLVAPTPGNISVGVVKLRGKPGGEHARISVTGLKGHPGLSVVLASHVSTTKGVVTRTILYAAVNNGKRRISGNLPPPDLDPLGLAVIAMVEDEKGGGFTWNGYHASVLDRPARATFVGATNAELATKTQAVDVVDELKDWVYKAPDPWQPKPSEVAALDTGHYDDGHAFGWKPSPKVTKDLIVAVTRGDWATELDKLFEAIVLDRPPSTGSTSGTTTTAPKTAGYTCSGPNNVIFDNWNTDVVANGGTAATFNTGGKAYCVNTLATYHWNGGKGATPGKISLLEGGKTVATWQAVGQAPDGSPGKINWIANIPQGSAPVVVQGAFTCKDSSTATWAQNAASKRIGFCRVFGQVATKSP